MYVIFLLKQPFSIKKYAFFQQKIIKSIFFTDKNCFYFKTIKNMNFVIFTKKKSTEENSFNELITTISCKSNGLQLASKWTSMFLLI